jgi:hypothetical protein
LIHAFIRAIRSSPTAGPEWAELEEEFIRRTTPSGESGD